MSLKLKNPTVSATVNSTEHPVRMRVRKAKKGEKHAWKGDFARQPRTSLKGLSSDDVSPRPHETVAIAYVCTSVARPYVCFTFLNKKKQNGRNGPREKHRR